MKMTDCDWTDFRYFKKTENWGNPNEIEKDLVALLEEFRHKINEPILITSGTQGNHIDGSFHYKGMAVDIVFPLCPRIRLPEILLVALQFNWGGIGLYPHWVYDNRAIGGMHVDIRPTTRKHTWIGLTGNRYVPMTFKDLNRFFT